MPRHWPAPSRRKVMAGPCSMTASAAARRGTRTSARAAPRQLMAQEIDRRFAERETVRLPVFIRSPGTIHKLGPDASLPTSC